ncbi:MAG: HEAT repeat domain-containing protein [Nitrospira sp.]|nr:HEAT repeat domain-containing protein [Nitrospira sp.]
MTTIADTDILQYLEQLNEENSMIRRDAIESLTGVKDARVLYPLIKALQDEDPGIQQAAIDAFIAYNDEAAVYNLLPLLFDNRVNVRNMAQEILEKIGGSGVKLIGLHIKVKDENVRKMIADILGKIKDPDSESLLLEMLKDHNSNVRSSAAEGLGRVGHSSAIVPLIELLNDEAWVAFFAAGALGKIGDSRAIIPLMGFIKSAHVDLQITAIDALGQIGSEEAANALISILESVQFDAIKSAVENLIKITHGNIDKVIEKIEKGRLIKYIVDIVKQNEISDLNRKMDFIQALSRLQTSDSSAYILKLLSDVEPGNIDLINSAIDALKELKDEEILIHTLKNESKTCVVVSLHVLGFLKSVKSVPFLIEIFDSSVREIKIEIISVLSEIGGKESLKFLLDMLSYDDGHVRAAAAKGLSILAEPETTDIICNRISIEEYRDVVEQIVNCLVEIYYKYKLPVVYQGFLSNLSNEKSFVREEVLKGLGLLGNKGASVYIESLINDEDWRVRRACLETMSILNSKGLFDGMIAGVTDERDEIRIFVAKLAVKYPEERSIDLLISLLSDRNNRVVCKAIEGLTILKAKKAIPFLTDLSTTGDKLIEDASIDAISHISGYVKDAYN